MAESRIEAMTAARREGQYFECVIWTAAEVWLQTQDESGKMQLSCVGPRPLCQVRAFCELHAIGLVIRTDQGDQWIAPAAGQGSILDGVSSGAGPGYWGRRRDRS